MSTAWAWSRRALAATRQLASEWSICDDIRAVLDVGTPTKSEQDETQRSESEVPQVLPTLDSYITPWLFDEFDHVNQALPFGLFGDMDLQGWNGPYTAPDALIL